MYIAVLVPISATLSSVSLRANDHVPIPNTVHNGSYVQLGIL